MKHEPGVCEECHDEPKAANGGLREAGTKPVCRDCGAERSDARRQRCLDCEVHHAFDALGEKIEARRRSNQIASSTGGSTS